MKVLVIGGTGPTGPHIVNGLLDRGHDVSVLNRGAHDTGAIPAHVERIVGDPHFRETLADALVGRHYDIIVATYGRIRYVAEVVASHTHRLISVGGSPGYRGTRTPESLYPQGLQVPLPEDAPKVETEEEFRFGYLAKISEDAVLAHHARGDYVATHLRYPLVYGPRQLAPSEWWVIRRILDKRQHIVLPDGGLTVQTRGYSENMAHAVLLAVDHPDASGGKIYNCGDVLQFTMAQWVELIASTLGAALDIVSVPAAFAYPARDLMIRRTHSHHQLFDLHAIRSDLGYTDQTSPVDAMAKTVRWYLDNPVDESEQQRADLAAHYRTEDAMAAVCREAVAKLAEVEHVERDFSHPYAHPKRPGLGLDHMNR
ncbi:MAG: NAD-dependent epimerase/dehydratase family protein [Pseudomonadota bacterium]